MFSYYAAIPFTSKIIATTAKGAIKSNLFCPRFIFFLRSFLFIIPKKRRFLNIKKTRQKTAPNAQTKISHKNSDIFLNYQKLTLRIFLYLFLAFFFSVFLSAFMHTAETAAIVAVIVKISIILYFLLTLPLYTIGCAKFCTVTCFFRQIFLEKCGVKRIFLFKKGEFYAIFKGMNYERQ